MKYENIRHMLRTIFVADFSLPEDAAISIYVSGLKVSGKEEIMKHELSEGGCRS
ncbi:hypothetical protein [Metapseudomonas otitidis]|uniref:hypothetical protein n=1 Tax=Metapseudomonas otitidis TaxID=319939 RepID=UPI0013F6896F|nr:hypothetical protein [Pseudomonas otitidis]